MKNFLVKIITPEKVAFEKTVVSATFPTFEGELTLLAGHQSIIVAIASGELRIQDEIGEVEAFFATNGVAKMDNNVLTILIDQLEHIAELSVHHAEEAYERARILKDDAGKMQALDFARFEALLEKELGRVRVARKYKR